MKISKRQLKRIIKEEKQKLLKEQANFPINDSSTRARLFADLNAAIGALMQAGMDPHEMAQELYGLGEDVETNAMEWLR